MGKRLKQVPSVTNSLRGLTIALAELFAAGQDRAQAAPFIANINARSTTNMDGQWQAIVDPYDAGALNYRAEPRLLPNLFRLSVTVWWVMSFTLLQPNTLLLCT
jgi:hypothetical protein